MAVPPSCFFDEWTRVIGRALEHHGARGSVDATPARKSSAVTGLTYRAGIEE